jgi:D-alanine-D-alanine ligase
MVQKLDVSAFGKVAVVLGGHSAERSVSLDSGSAVLTALRAEGVDAHAFDPQERPITEIANYDRAFITLHGRGGEDGQLQGLLEWLGVPYTGSGIIGSAIGMDKVRTKQIWLGANLPTMPFYVFNNQTVLDDVLVEQVVSKLSLPLIIKPVHEGSSIGMSKVETREQLLPAITLALQHDQTVMAEAWISGKEFSIVIIDDKALPIIRLQPPASVAFYDFEAKYISNDTQYSIPSGLTDSEEAALQALSVNAFKVAGAKGWGRIDAMQDNQGQFWLLEVNTAPGMTSHSLVPMAAKATGMDFNALCLHILQQTF